MKTEEQIRQKYKEMYKALTTDKDLTMREAILLEQQVQALGWALE